MGDLLKRFGMLICALFAALTGSLAAAPRITFTPTGATAEGILPGGDAVWFVHSVTDFGGWPRRSKIVRVTADEDRDGRVVLEAGVERSSVWAVVDYASGEFAIARPEGASPLRLMQERGGDWAAGREHLDFPVSVLDVLLVRPGRGVWFVRSHQGGVRDGDGLQNNNLRVKVKDMKRMHGSEPASSAALPRDLVIAVHPTRLDTFVRSAGEGKP